MSDVTVLPDLIRREGRTFLQYIRESYPWAHAGQDARLRTKLMAFADAENEALTALGRQLHRRHIPLPFLGAFSSAFTNCNFLSIDFLVPKLAAAQRRDVAALERQAPAVADPALRAQLDGYLELKRRHLHELETLAGPGQAA